VAFLRFQISSSSIKYKLSSIIFSKIRSLIASSRIGTKSSSHSKSCLVTAIFNALRINLLPFSERISFSEFSKSNWLSVSKTSSSVTANCIHFFSNWSLNMSADFSLRINLQSLNDATISTAFWRYNRCNDELLSSLANSNQSSNLKNLFARWGLRWEKSFIASESPTIPRDSNPSWVGFSKNKSIFFIRNIFFVC